jgi:predicted Zn-ribbon and HTH transcriptional regulator
MGRTFDATCRECGDVFRASEGGGRRFEAVRCTECGEGGAIGHEEIAEAHRRFVERSDEAMGIQDDREADVAFERARAEFFAVVNAAAGECSCGGRFRHDAPLRCPRCRSTDLERGNVRRLFD